MNEVGVYSLALQTVFKFGPKLKKKKAMAAQSIYIYTPDFVTSVRIVLGIDCIKKNVEVSKTCLS